MKLPFSKMSLQRRFGGYSATARWPIPYFIYRSNCLHAKDTKRKSPEKFIANILNRDSVCKRILEYNFHHRPRVLSSTIVRKLSLDCQMFFIGREFFPQSVGSFFPIGREFFLNRSGIFSQSVGNFFPVGREFFPKWSGIFLSSLEEKLVFR